LEYFYHPSSDVRIAHNGLDLGRFNPEKRAGLREEARRVLGLSSSQFVLLLIGNDWKSKGLPWLLKAAAELGSPHLCILVAGRDNPAPFQDAIQQYHLAGRVHFLPPRPDVEFYYAAADAYVSPSLEDAFALPPAEAMACGLPIITSRNNGGSEVVSSGEDGFVLEDPSDFRTLSNLLQRLMSDHDLSARISAAAVRTAKKLTWDATAAQVRQTWEEVKSLKGGARVAEWS
jgi:UDP-glucose:(heptosyl)LPS alpha-1,3-glucosyltransferase